MTAHRLGKTLPASVIFRHSPVFTIFSACQLMPETTAVEDPLTPYLYRFGVYELDEAHMVFRQNGVVLPMPAKPWTLLLLLLKNAPKVVAHQEICHQVWAGRTASGGTVNQVLVRLRQFLQDEDQTLIKNARGVGFCFTGDVQRIAQNKAENSVENRISATTKLRGRQPWKLLRPMTTGGKSPVWLGEHSGTHEQRIFKFAFDVFGKSSLKKEVLASRLLIDEREDGFLPVLHWDFAEAPYFIELPYLNAITLEEWIAQSSELPTRDYQVSAVARIAEVASVLASAHACGIIHGDLSLKNVLVQRDDADHDYAVLNDFGSAQVSATERILALELSMPFERQDGTPRLSTLLYAAPEILRGEATSAASDVYALGVLLFQTLSRDARKMLSPGWENSIDDAILCDDILSMCAPLANDRPDAALIYQRLTQLSARRDTLATSKTLAAQAQVIADNRKKRMRYFTTILILSVFAAIASLGWLRAKQNAELAQRNAAVARENLLLAQRNEAKAKNVLLYLGKNVFSKIDNQITVSDALKQSFKDAEADLKDQPDLAIDVYLQFAQIFSATGESELTAQAIDRIYKMGEITPKIDTSLKFNYAGTLLLRGDYQKAKPIYREVIAQFDETNEQEAVFINFSRLYLAEMEIVEGNLEEGKSVLDAIALNEREALNTNQLVTLNAKDTWLGHYFEAKNNWQAAEDRFSTILKRSENRPELNLNQSAQRGLARCDAKKGDYKRAIARMEQAIPNIYKALGSNGPQHIAELEFATLLAQAGQKQRSIALLQQLLKLDSGARFGKIYQDKAKALLAELLQNQ